MIYTLTMLMCTQYSADCGWRAIASYTNERACMFAGLANSPYNPQFKCVAERIPLPRPRPTQ